jgi:hypothetical protein
MRASSVLLRDLKATQHAFFCQVSPVYFWQRHKGVTDQYVNPVTPCQCLKLGVRGSLSLLLSSASYTHCIRSQPHAPLQARPPAARRLALQPIHSSG